MPLLFSFTDAPNIGDHWETNLDIDVLTHTRPPLLIQRDRFARNFGPSIAQCELRYCVMRGLKAYGYNILPSLYYLVANSLLRFETQAYNDRITACQAVTSNSDDPESIRAQAQFAALEQTLWTETLDSPEMVEKFVSGPLTNLAQLNPIARMDAIYKLRAARFALNIPFSRHADAILAQLFVETPESAPYCDISGHTFSITQEVLIRDIVEGLIERLEQNTDFLDQVLTDWVIPHLDDRFPEIDDEIEKFRQLIPEDPLTRDEYIQNSKVDSDWLTLAKKLGSPVPPPILSKSKNSTTHHPPFTPTRPQN